MVVTRKSAAAQGVRRDAARATRPSRSLKRPCYNESSDSAEASAAESTPSPPPPPARRAASATPRAAAPRSRRPRPGAAPPPRSKSSSSSSSSSSSPSLSSSSSSTTCSRQRAASAKPPSASSSRAKKRKPSPLRHEQQPAVDGFVPDWRDPRVPFGCWADIFHYAARVGAADTPSPRWLAQAATTCKVFAEPALTALYRCPVIKHSLTAKYLASLLARPVSETRFNYRAKIETMLIDIHTVPLGALWLLIHPLPRLKELIVYTPLDQPPYRELDKNIRWHYPSDLFNALQASAPRPDGSRDKAFATRLESWEWSGRLIGGQGHVPDVASLAAVHQTLPFRQLAKLALTNFQVPSLSNLSHAASSEEELETYHADGVVIDDIARAISQLPSLNHLVFESSTVMSHRLLPLLPTNLSHLELINCWEVKSDDLGSFLGTHGGRLRTLSLLHNQSLDLGFLTGLSDACPGLRELHMNLSYYRHHDSVNDADPMYEQALVPGQVPTWPSTLRVINIDHIRDWSVEAAETFFQSLVDSAARLPDLRHIAIKTMLNIPWQARATMRQEWRDKMESVFLRPLRPPADRRTLRRAPGHEEQRPPRVESKRAKKTHAPHSPPSRRSGRIAAHGRRILDLRRDGQASKGLRRQGSRPVYTDPDTDQDEESSSASGEEAPDAAPPKPDLHIQGLCNTVSILVDNQKVGEQQYGMDDFLDRDDDESEEEWDGDYDDDDDDVAF